MFGHCFGEFLVNGYDIKPHPRIHREADITTALALELLGMGHSERAVSVRRRRLQQLRPGLS